MADRYRKKSIKNYIVIYYNDCEDPPCDFEIIHKSDIIRYEERFKYKTLKRGASLQIQYDNLKLRAIAASNLEEKLVLKKNLQSISEDFLNWKARESEKALLRKIQLDECVSKSIGSLSEFVASELDKINTDKIYYFNHLELTSLPIEKKDALPSNGTDLSVDKTEEKENNIVKEETNHIKFIAEMNHDVINDKYRDNTVSEKDNHKDVDLDDNTFNENDNHKDVALDDNTVSEKDNYKNAILDDNALNKKVNQKHVALDDNTFNEKDNHKDVVLDDNAVSEKNIHVALNPNIVNEKVNHKDVALDDNTVSEMLNHKDAALGDYSVSEKNNHKDVALEDNIVSEKDNHKDVAPDGENHNMSISEEAFINNDTDISIECVRRQANTLNIIFETSQRQSNDFEKNGSEPKAGSLLRKNRKSVGKKANELNISIQKTENEESIHSKGSTLEEKKYAKKNMNINIVKKSSEDYQKSRAIKTEILTPKRNNAEISSDENNGRKKYKAHVANKTVSQVVLAEYNNYVLIGENKTLIPTNVYTNINWGSYTAATRKLLSAVFSRDILATHTLSGKPSPAFLNADKELKKALDWKKVDDIVSVVSEKCYISSSVVRSAITTKCADENKMKKKRMEKIKNKEN